MRRRQLVRDRERILAHGRNWDLTSALLRSYGVAVEPVVGADAEWAARRSRRGEGLSLADRLCLAVGSRLEATVWTADTEVGRRRPDPADPLNGEDSMTTGPDAERALDAIADAEQYPYWYDDADEPDSNPTLVRAEHCDLCVVGGGYTGLWTAIIAKERDPSRDVILIDAAEIGSAASGRNGGFMESTLTHGIANGQRRFPDEIECSSGSGWRTSTRSRPPSALRHRLRLRTHRGDRRRHERRCAGIRRGVRDDAEQLQRLGQDARWLDATRCAPRSTRPRTSAGCGGPGGRRWSIGPARVGSESGRRAARGADLRGHQGDRDRPGRHRHRGPDAARPGPGRPRRPGHQCLQASTAPAPPLHRAGLRLLHGHRTADPEQLAGIGWRNRQGLSDIANQFHYYRLTEDNRILWGGYDAVYFWRGRVAAELESRPATWATLSRHFFTTFPQLDDVRFSHIWGGAIDTCSRFCVFWGTAQSGRVAYAPGTPASAWRRAGSARR